MEALVTRMDSKSESNLPLARILEVYKGKDENVRSAKIQISDMSYVVKLCPLKL